VCGYFPSARFNLRPFFINEWQSAGPVVEQSKPEVDPVFQSVLALTTFASSKSFARPGIRRMTRPIIPTMFNNYAATLPTNDPIKPFFTFLPIFSAL
jgi:hypothetical protein